VIKLKINNTLNVIRKYYIDTTIYNLCLSILIVPYAGVIWASVVFGTIGTIIGFVIYSYFKKNEYYLYYNHGYSKKMLMIRVWTMNLFLMAVCIGIHVMIINLF